jgi:Asp-tRNA(Asn)/Glu-tRNA(Gln) amidotransferase A subunit family amidase
MTSGTAPRARSYFAARDRFESGADTPRAFLERCIETIAELEPAIGAFTATNLSGARTAADMASDRWRKARILSEIDGMPIAVKDIMVTADMPTGQGSPLFTGWRSGYDCAAVAAAREAGAVVLGKAVTAEFAGTQPGATRNPHDPSRTPGGSSSGSAAAVAAGMVAGALGSQVIGSTVRPASFCGCFGFKPSVGGINRGGSFDVYSQSCTSTFAATLEEAWCLARAISARAGGDPGHPGLTGPLRPPKPDLPERVAVLETAGWPAATEEAKDGFASACDRLRAAGVEILDRHGDSRIAALDAALEGATPLARTIIAWETRWPINTYAKDMDRSALSEEMLNRLATAEAMTLEDYQALLVKRDAVRAQYAELADRCAVCITLSAPGAAPVGLGWTGDASFAIPGSLLGVPALSLPVLRDDGLPLGLQVLGQRDRDAAMFAAAAAILTVLQA